MDALMTFCFIILYILIGILSFVGFNEWFEDFRWDHNRWYYTIFKKKLNRVLFRLSFIILWPIYVVGVFSIGTVRVVYTLISDIFE